MNVEIIDIGEQAQNLRGNYKNTLLTSLNDHSIRISMMTAPYFWHYHPNSDEAFIVVEGALIVELEDQQLELSAGQMCTIPQGTPHRTQPRGAKSINLAVERTGIETVRIDVPE